MAHQHFMILTSALTPALRASFKKHIDAETCSWFNYTTDGWVVCTNKKGPELLASVARVLGTETLHIVVEIECSSVIGGLLPEEAWVWLKRHDLVMR